MGAQAHRFSQSGGLVTPVIVACALYWVLASAVDAMVLPEASFLEQLVAPEASVKRTRTIMLFLIGVFAAIAQHLANMGTRGRHELQQTLDRLGNLVEERTAELSEVNNALVAELSQRKHMEESLKASVARFRAVADYTYDWENWVGPDGKLIWINAPVERLTGYSVQECFAMDDFPAPLIHEDDRERIAKDFKEAVLGHTSGDNTPFRIRCKDGTTRWGAVSWKPIYDATGACLGHRSTIRDVTEFRRMKEALNRSEKMEMLGMLAAGIAHDFNNLTALVVGQLDTVRSTTSLTADCTARIEVARKAAQQAGGMTRSLETLVRRIPAEKQAVSLNETCRNAAELLKHLSGKTVKVEWTTRDETLRALADQTQIQQVLMNLVSNARDAMSDGGVVRVSLTAVDVPADVPSAPSRACPGRYARIDVVDTGVGIAPEVMDRIFEPFFTTKQIGSRTGFGLAIVDSIAEEHKGWIGVESTPGAGSTFSLFLPCCCGDCDRAEATNRGVPRASSDALVLVVQDDDLQRSVLASSLRDAGYSVLQARDGDDALRTARAQESPIQAMVVGDTLDDMAGTECLERMEALLPDLVGLLIAQPCTERGRATETKRGPYPILLKPFQATDLVRAIHRLLNERSVAG